MRALLVVFPGCALGEVAPLLTLLDGAVKVVTAAPSLASVRTTEGIPVAPDVVFAQASAGGALLIVPGGDIVSVIDDPALASLLARAPTVAAICNGALIAAKAGLARGRRVTHTATERWAPRPEFDALLALASTLFEGATYVDDDVVVDGPLVTAKPWAAIDFAKKAAVHAGLLSRDEAASRARYQRGFRDRTFGDPYQRWAIFLTQIDGVATSRADVEAHVAHLRALERDGRLELAGPFPEHRSGLVIVRARTREEAQVIAEADPFVTRGVRRAELRPWRLSCDDDDHLLG